MKKVDKLLLLNIIIILIIGLLMVYSASNVVSSYKYNDEFYYFKRQLINVIIGLFLMYIVSKINIFKIMKYTNIYFIISLILLILVLFIGSKRGGARSWIGFGSFSIQPSEFIKLTLILIISYILYKYRMYKLKNFILLISLVVVVFLIIMLQPDFGTGLVIVLSSIILLFLSDAKIKYFMILFILGILFSIVLIIMAPYRIERITSFLNPWTDPLGSGFQGIQAILAVAPSGLFGVGYNNSIQKHFFLPEAQNDFIYAIICEELGLIGAVVVLLLYTLFIIRVISISVSLENKYLFYLSNGIGCSIFIQAIINILVVIGLLPITGITLPLISYGGSSVVITLIGCGILLNISKYKVSYE